MVNLIGSNSMSKADALALIDEKESILELAVTNHILVP